MDLSTATGIYLGATGVQSVYLGSTLIWPAGHNYANDYFTIVSLENNNDIQFYVSEPQSSGSFTPIHLSIDVSTDGGSTWTQYTASTTGTVLATLNQGDKLLIKGNNNEYDPLVCTHTFRSPNAASFNVEGNIMSLIYGDNFAGQTSFPSNTSRNFDNLFWNSQVVSAENLILPATTLMNSCYNSMFYGCSSLTTPPALPATQLANYCYNGMFAGCSNLVTAPALPATTLATGCYDEMFFRCSSLTTAPDLPAPILVDYCYYYMFYKCSSLQYIKCLATDISAGYCTTNWVGDVSSTGTFVKDATMNGWTTGASYGTPAGWTVQNA